MKNSCLFLLITKKQSLLVFFRSKLTKRDCLDLINKRRRRPAFSGEKVGRVAGRMSRNVKHRAVDHHKVRLKAGIEAKRQATCRGSLVDGLQFASSRFSF